MCLTTTTPDENPGRFLDCNNETDPKNADNKYFRMVTCKKTYDMLYTVSNEKNIGRVHLVRHKNE